MYVYRLEVVKYLVDKGVNIHADDDWALRTASLNRYYDMIKFLITQGANISKLRPNELSTLSKDDEFISDIINKNII